MFTHFTEHQAKMDRRHMIIFAAFGFFLDLLYLCSFSTGHGISTGLPAVGCSF